ncbi:hypothetical protein AVEN_269256-1 [Araneus ventricosus]|uniref:Uncharacterized protein n=1 Tax=Araneus ventricosus TaxID=182803 RepID=A0A4Y2J752_ARAVE|nr:hypothetical protein AVEN_269256-1 [Araneus ventricosus]
MGLERPRSSDFGVEIIRSTRYIVAVTVKTSERGDGLSTAFNIRLQFKITSENFVMGVYSGTPGWVPLLMCGTQPNRGYQNRSHGFIAGAGHLSNESISI